jgi:hypothetical protein
MEVALAGLPARDLPGGEEEGGILDDLFNRLTGRGTLAVVPDGANAGDSGLPPEAEPLPDFDTPDSDMANPDMPWSEDSGILDPANAGRLSR